MFVLFGFNNFYVLGMCCEFVEFLGVLMIFDFVDYFELKFRFGNEFIECRDGWGLFCEVYGLFQNDVLGMDYDVVYGQLDVGFVDVIDVYMIDVKIKLYDVFVLEDDCGFFF